MTHTEPHPLAGHTVTVNPAARLFGHTDTTPFAYRIDDWNDRIFGRSWGAMEGHPASLAYAMRAADGNLPFDDEVVYGKDNNDCGHLIHVSEITEAGEDR